jgi:hypothetical protein
MTAQHEQLALYGGLALAVWWLMFRRDPVTGQTGLDTIVQGTAIQAGQLPGDIFSGAVIGVGKSVGVPATSLTKCQADIAAGDTWNASFDCTASEFVNYLRS